MKNEKRIWHTVKSLKDMPHKSRYYLLMTDMAWSLTFSWDAHTRRGYYLSVRNKYNPETDNYDDLGKVDGVRFFIRNPTFAWADIPGMNELVDGPDYYEFVK